jgi:hypothetical protein
MRGVRRSCIRAIDEENEEERWANIIMFNWNLIDDRWLVGKEQHNNQPPTIAENQGEVERFTDVLVRADRRGNISLAGRYIL